jgi:hypothetical protein
MITTHERNDSDITDAIMKIAGFPKGSYMGKSSNIFGVSNGPECAFAFHRDEFDKVNRDVLEALKIKGPTIVVGQKYRNDRNTQTPEPTDVFVVRYDTHYVKESHISMIEEKLKEPTNTG